MALDPLIRETILGKLGADYADAYPKQVEQDYPHVLNKLAALQNGLETEKFFDQLLLTQRTDRKGLSMAAFSEILLLIKIYRKNGLMEEPARRNGDFWNWVSDVGRDSRHRLQA